MPCKIKSGKAAKLTALKIMKLDSEENPFSLPRAVGLLFVQHISCGQQWQRGTTYKSPFLCNVMALVTHLSNGLNICCSHHARDAFCLWTNFTRLTNDTAGFLGIIQTVSLLFYEQQLRHALIATSLSGKHMWASHCRCVGEADDHTYCAPPILPPCLLSFHLSLA